MADLTNEMKLFIVHALACYDSPSQVAAAVKEEFGVEITRQHVSRYDPSKASGHDVSTKLRAVFEETRKAFLGDISQIPIANQSYRLRVLQRTLDKVDKQGNTAMVSQLLEQAAKESGGSYTNKSKVEHSGEIKTPELKLVLHGTPPPPKTE